MNGRFRLDARGQLTSEDSSGVDALAGRVGSYDLAPTCPDLLCFVRRPPRGGAIEPPRVTLAGDASGFPLSDLIAFLSQSRWSAVIRLHAPDAQRMLAIKDGEVRGATSDDPSDRLGEVLVRLGFTTHEAIERILEENPAYKLGKTLVERGVLQSHDLWKCINHQVSEIFHAMMLCREGVFFLVDQPLDERSLQNIQLSTQSLLMDSIRKFDEMAHFRKKIAHGRMFVARKRPSDGALEEDEDRVLLLANGDKSILELGQAAKLSEFDVTKVIFRLLEGGFVSIAEHALAALPLSEGQPGLGRQGAARQADARRVIHTFNAIFRDIFLQVAGQGKAEQLHRAANAALSGGGLSSSPVLTGLKIDANGNLPEQRLAEQFRKSQAHLGSEPVAALRQALSDVMFFLLFQVGELLEAKSDEELASRVKTLLASLDDVGT